MNAPVRNALPRQELALVDQSQHQLDPTLNATSLLFDPQRMNAMMAIAEIMASGAAVTVPEHLRGKPGDCMAIVMQSVQWGMNPYAVAQKTHVVSGRLGYEAQLVSAVLNSSNLLQKRLAFEHFGPWEKVVGRFKEVESRTKKDDNGSPKKFIVPAWQQTDEQGLGVRCIGYLRGEREPRVLELLLTQARTRNSTLWAEDPKQQLAYLAQKRWARLYAADVLLGVYTPDELEEFEPPKNMGAADEVTVPDALVMEAGEAARKGVAEYQAWFKNTTELNRALLRHGGATSEHERLKAVAVDADKRRTVDNGSAPTAASSTPVAAPAATTAPEPAAPTSDDAPPTWAQLMDRINSSGDEVALMIVEDWVAEWPDAGQKQELEAAVTRRRGELGIGGAK